MKYTDYEIICVDDDLDVLDVSKDVVASLGYKVIAFHQVEKAVEYIKKNKTKIMLILSDLRMDDINGFGFKKMLKKEALDIPFVIITGYWTKEMSAEAMELGVEAFVEKPVNTEIVQENIEKFGYPRAEMIEDEKEMVQGFLDESTPMLDEIESLILELEEDPNDEQTLSVYFRLLHTIKGTASCVGLTNLGSYTHRYEDFIGDLRNKKIPMNTESTNVLLNGLDDLKDFFSYVEDKGTDSDLEFENHVAKFDFKEDLSKTTDQPQQDNIAPTSAKKSEEKKEDDKMTVSMEILNDFMEESGELTVIRNSILKTVKIIESKYRGDRDIENLNGLLGSMHNVTGNIQGKIEQMRQVPLKSTFRPFKRLVRDLSKKLNKKVDFETIGEELSVDNTIAKLFNNTLIHVVRNSLDHGLETSEKRMAAGKDEVGKLKFKVTESGEDILLQIIDDGNGINPEIVKNKALEKGLYTEEELNQMSETEIINMIFASGFSTAEAVSDLSGRGVGMDMVRGSFEAMGGEIFVESEVGKGSTFNLKVPIPKSVLIITSLSVECCGHNFIFQMDDVAEVIRYEKELPHSKLYEVDHKKIISHNGEMIQIVSLADVLNLEQAKTDKKQDEVTNIVVLRVGKTKFGVEVNQIFEFEEVVSRKIPEGIDQHGLYSGASLLGSGEVSMIIDAEGVANYMTLELQKKAKKLSVQAEQDQHDEDLNEFMLFKYNQTDELSIELDYVDRLETMNSSRFEKVGDNTVIKYLNKPLRLIDAAYMIGLTDKNHLDSIAPDSVVPVIVVTASKDIQFGVVVSQLEEIQYTHEQINTDTVDLDGLKGCVFINDKTISILDINYLTNQLFKRLEIQRHEEDEGQDLDMAA